MTEEVMVTLEGQGGQEVRLSMDRAMVDSSLSGHRQQLDAARAAGDPPEVIAQIGRAISELERAQQAF